MGRTWLARHSCHPPSDWPYHPILSLMPRPGLSCSLVILSFGVATVCGSCLARLLGGHPAPEIQTAPARGTRYWTQSMAFSSSSSRHLTGQHGLFRAVLIFTHKRPKRQGPVRGCLNHMICSSRLASHSPDGKDRKQTTCRAMSPTRFPLRLFTHTLCSCDQGQPCVSAVRLTGRIVLPCQLSPLAHRPHRLHRTHRFTSPSTACHGW